VSNIAKVKTFDIANGEGIRTSVFFSGCEFKCKGCFNKELWDFNTGEQFNVYMYENKIKPTINEHVAGISILGGEPLHYKNLKDVSDLITWFKKDFPNKNIWLWSGYTWGELIEKVIHDKGSKYLTNILSNIDILVDGQFIEDQKDLTLKWRGSRNQRVIDIRKTLSTGEVVLYG
jgi:anaerobic ribonucleoside-triphosphate reductase activating protein